MKSFLPLLLPGLLVPGAKERKPEPNVILFLAVTATLSFALLTTACEPKACLPDCLTKESGFAPEVCPEGGNCTFEYYPDSEILRDSAFNALDLTIVEGDFLVFRYQFVRIVEPPLMDAGLTETVWFQVRPAGDTFIITAGELESAQATFQRMCFCPEVGYLHVTAGCIYGKKTGPSTWKVSFNLTAKGAAGDYVKMVEGEFGKQAVGSLQQPEGGKQLAVGSRGGLQ